MIRQSRRVFFLHLPVIPTGTAWIPGREHGRIGRLRVNPVIAFEIMAAKTRFFALSLAGFRRALGTMA